MTPVYYEHFEVGQLLVDEDGPSFVYDPRWLDTKGAFPISLTVPLEDRQFGSDVILPWLINLLPEEQNLITIARNLGVSPQDALGLLDYIGNDVAGALSIGAPRVRGNPDYRLIKGSDALEKIITDLPKKPFLAGEDGISMSLAGAQEKLPVAMLDGGMAIPVNGAPSTHILKPDVERLYGSVYNEALCLVLARRCRLDAAPVTTGIAGERAYLLVDRYDRKITGKRVTRIHQEDFCQAQAKSPAAKYENNRTGLKGPGMHDLFRLVAEHMTGADTNKLVNAVIFNVLICNTDSHAKNYSILLSGDRPRLAPLYDILCAASWDNVTQNLPQRISNQNRGNHIHGRHWKRMAQSCGLSATMVVERVVALADGVQNEIDAACEEVKAMPAGDHPMLHHFQNAIEARCRTIVANLKD